MEDSETKAIALERVAELEHLMSRSHEIENELMAKLVDLETENNNIRRENEDLLVRHLRS